MRGYPHFSLWIPITLAKTYFFTHGHNLCKNTSVLGGTVLKVSHHFVSFCTIWITITIFLQNGNRDKGGNLQVAAEPRCFL